MWCNARPAGGVVVVNSWLLCYLCHVRKACAVLCGVSYACAVFAVPVPRLQSVSNACSVLALTLRCGPLLPLRMLSVQPGTRFGNGMCLPWASLLVRRNVRDCSDVVVTVGDTVVLVQSVM